MTADQRRRTNEPTTPVAHAAAGESVEAPPADDDWHPIARGWYEALAVSGQSVFYDASDWHTAYAVAESMSREFKPQPVVDKDGGVQWVSFPPKASAVMAWLKAGAVLLATEGDRRRAGLELVRGNVQEAETDVSELDDYRQRLRSS